jgi:hypothetical protein
MATRAKTSSPAKAPAAGKTKTAARNKPVAKAEAAPAKLSKPAGKARTSSNNKPAVKAAAAPVTQSQPAARKKTPSLAKAHAGKPAKPPVSEDQRRNYIEVAAYYIAERRGFFGTSAFEDWTQAEAEVDRMLREGKLNQ